MNCEQARDLAALAASGDVTVAEQRALELHIADCAECRAETAGFATVLVQLAALSVESVPDHAYAAVRARVAAEINGRRSGWLAAWPAFAAVVACSVMLVVLLRPEAPVATQPALIAETNQVEVSSVLPVVPSPRALPSHRLRRTARVATEPLVVQLLTDDPDVVIYWIADAGHTDVGRKGSKKEIVQ